MIPSKQPTIASHWTVAGKTMTFTECLAARRDRRGRIIHDIVRVDVDVSPGASR